MKKLSSKKMILNLLSHVAVATSASSEFGGGCAIYFYEPEKPKMLSKVNRKDLFADSDKGNRK